MRAWAIAVVMILGCKRDDPTRIEKPNDPAPSASIVAAAPRASKGRCLDGAFEKETPQTLGLDEPAFQPSPDGIGLGSIGGKPPPPAPYSLVATVDDAPAGADPDEGLRALCDGFAPMRACFDAARSQIAFHEYVLAIAAVDETGTTKGLVNVGNETLETCIAIALRATKLPKPAAAGSWHWRFVVVPPPSPDVESPLDAASVQRVLAANSRKMKSCYDKALTTAPTSSGKISVGFTIEPSGAVTKPHVTSTTITDAALASCILAAVGSLHFPEPATGSGDVVVPFKLEAAK